MSSTYPYEPYRPGVSAAMAAGFGAVLSSVSATARLNSFFPVAGFCPVMPARFTVEVRQTWRWLRLEAVGGEQQALAPKTKNRAPDLNRPHLGVAERGTRKRS